MAPVVDHVGVVDHSLIIVNLFQNAKFLTCKNHLISRKLHTDLKKPNMQRFLAILCNENENYYLVVRNLTENNKTAIFFLSEFNHFYRF